MPVTAWEVLASLRVRRGGGFVRELADDDTFGARRSVTRASALSAALVRMVVDEDVRPHTAEPRWAPVSPLDETRPGLPVHLPAAARLGPHESQAKRPVESASLGE